MDIRKLMNILENIEKKEEEPKKDEVSKNVEQDAQPEEQPKQHHKHHSHKDHAKKDHEKKDADSKDDSDDEGDESDEDDKDVDDSKNDEFKKMAGSLGDDLYVVSLYDFRKIADNDFTDARPNSEVLSMLKSINDTTAKKFANETGLLDSTNKSVSCLFLNDRNGKFFSYSAGDDGASFDPSGNVDGLVNDDVVEDNQTSALLNIQHNGNRYNKTLKKVTWEAGEQANSEIIYDILGSLVKSMRLPKLPEAPEDVKLPDLSGEELEAHKWLAKQMSGSEFEKRIMDKYNKKMAEKEAAKNAGVGREKR